MIDLSLLAEPFPPEDVSFRVGSTNGDKTKGMALAYIDARDVIDRLNAVCGPGGWQSDYPWSDGKRVTCRIGIKVGEEWIWKADGAGETDYEGEKGAFSDAFKRAAVKWGIGQYLYGLGNKWAAIESFGKSYRFVKDAYKDLRAGLPRPQPRQQAKPASVTPVLSEQDRYLMNDTAAKIHLGQIEDAESIVDLRDWLQEHASRAASLPPPWCHEIHAALVCRGYEVAATAQEFLAWRDSRRAGIEKLPAHLKAKINEKYGAALERFKEAVKEAAA